MKNKGKKKSLTEKEVRKNTSRRPREISKRLLRAHIKKGR